MNLLDSCGWIEIAADGPNAAWFEQALLSEAPVLVPSLCLFEVYRHLERHSGREIADAVAGNMQRNHTVELDPETALGGAELSRLHKLAAMDALIYATAQRHGATLWTQDAAFKDLPGVRFHPKKASRS